jgi:hypothetical protein
MRLRLLLCVIAIAACSDAPKPDGQAPPPRLASDSAPADLSKLKANIPAALPDTFTPLPRVRLKGIPDAPAVLSDAAEREQGISRFCYQEFGVKVDPKLVGAVAFVVTMEGNAVRSVRVGAQEWSSSAGTGVERCLVQKAPQAWKLLPGETVANGQYVVQVRFRPS